MSGIRWKPCGPLSIADAVTTGRATTGYSMALTALKIRKAGVGRHSDGHCLYLHVKPAGEKNWVLSIQLDGSRHDFPIGSAELVSLVEARKKAVEWRRLIKHGIDPLNGGQSWKPVALPAVSARAARTRKTHAERTALSDQRMFQSTIELLCEGGINGTTLKDVGERSGYSRSLAAARFETKARLLASLLQTMNARWAAEMADYMTGRTGLDAILAILDAVEQFLRQRPMWTKALFILWYESISSSDIKGALGDTHVREREGIVALVVQGQQEGSINKDVSPEYFSIQFMSLIFGTIYQWTISPADIDIHVTLRHVRDNLIKLLV